MKSRLNPQDLLQLLREPTLAALADETVREYVDWSQLAERPAPPGLSIEDTWEVLGLIRRFGATTLPIVPPAGPFWYNLNAKGAACLRFIQNHCRTDSILHQTIRQREGDTFLVRLRIHEAVATCRLDGIDIRPDQARRILKDGRAPRTQEERLVLNSYEMLGELDSVASDGFSPELVLGLYDRLTHGVDLDAIERGPRRSNLAGTRNSDQMIAAASERGILSDICDYANGTSGDPSEPAAIKSYLVFSAVGFWQPLPDLNETIARHMIRLFAVKNDSPVLACLPTSVKMQKWFEGSLQPGIARFSDLKRRQVVPGTIDGTEDILTHLQLTAAAIDRLLDYVEKTRKEDTQLQDALDNHTRLNYRQRLLLTQALASPATEFTTRRHQTAHHVVYQTARADLLELVHHGYLQKTVRGRTFVFVPSANLRKLVKVDPMT